MGKHALITGSIDGSKLQYELVSNGRRDVRVFLLDTFIVDNDRFEIRVDGCKNYFQDYHTSV